METIAGGILFPQLLNTHFICIVVNRVGLPLVVDLLLHPVFMNACPLEVCLLEHFSKQLRHA